MEGRMKVYYQILRLVLLSIVAFSFGACFMFYFMDLFYILHCYNLLKSTLLSIIMHVSCNESNKFLFWTIGISSKKNLQPWCQPYTSIENCSVPKRIHAGFQIGSSRGDTLTSSHRKLFTLARLASQMCLERSRILNMSEIHGLVAEN